MKHSSVSLSSFIQAIDKILVTHLGVLSGELKNVWFKINKQVLVGMQTSAVTVENSMEFPQRTKNGAAL